MPSKKYGKRRSVRRKSKRFTGRRANSNKIARQDYLSAQGPLIRNPAPFLKRGPVNDVYFAKHRYIDTITLNTEAVAGLMGAAYFFRLNSLYDCDQSATGHQPSGFSELTALFSRYCVYGVSCRLSVGNSTDANTLLGYWVHASSMSLAMDGMDPRRIGEAPGQSAIFSQTDGGVGAWRTVDLGYTDIARVQGRTMTQLLTEDNFSANYTTNPVTTPYLQLSAGSTTGLFKSLSVRVEFVFHTRWTQRKSLSTEA